MRKLFLSCLAVWMVLGAALMVSVSSPPAQAQETNYCPPPGEMRLSNSYWMVFNRELDEGGARYWLRPENYPNHASFLVRGSLNESQHSVSISDWYQRIFGRLPSETALDYWSSISRVDALIHIAASLEAQLAYRSRTGCVIRSEGIVEAASSEWASVEIPSTRNGSQQPSLAVREIVWAHFGDLGIDVYVQALRVARCESGYRVDVHRTTAAPHRLLGDIGLFQVNNVHQEWLRNNGWITTGEDLKNPDINSRFARRLYDQRGWEDWRKSYGCLGF